MPSSLREGICYLCEQPTSTVNDAGNFVCDWCAHQLAANPEVEDEVAYHQAICTHPMDGRTKDNRCKYCNKVIT